MNLRKILAVSIISVLLTAFQSSAAPTTAPAKSFKPNIIFVLADDLGWTDLSCFGSKYYQTPNLDRLATQGMKFTCAYTCAPNCAPTRAALMSGEYEPRTGIYTVGGIDRFDWQSRPLRPVDNVTQLPFDKITIADALKREGYATAMFGKWHLGQDAAHHPSKRGFDEAITSMGVHFDFKTDPPTAYPKGEYLADFLTEHAVDFIKRKKDGPFFLYLPHFGVHAPLQAKTVDIDRFKDKPLVGGHNNPTYAGMIYSVDESVGKIMATLDELGIADNTLLIFSSDNGGVGGYVREGIKAAGDTTDNTPLRGGKGMLYEGGVRVPFIARWPGKIAPATESDQAICSVDFYPTFLEVAGVKPTSGYVLDGVSILPTLLTGKAIERDAIYWHFPGYLGAGNDKWRTKPAGAIRSGDFKLIEFFEDNHVELYNLKEDLSQKHDLAKERPELAKELHDKLIAWRKDTNAKMPTANKDRRPPNEKKKGKKGEDE
jgi:arylsulfatase A-like enzyme